LLFREAIFPVEPDGSREVPLPVYTDSDDTVALNLSLLSCIIKKTIYYTVIMKLKFCQNLSFVAIFNSHAFRRCTSPAVMTTVKIESGQAALSPWQPALEPYHSIGTSFLLV
jgi:hypothetical protein